MSKKTDEKELSFLGHVFELRGHLIRSIVAIMIGSVICTIFWGTISEKFIMAPLKYDFPTYQMLNALGEKVGVGQIYEPGFNYTKELKNLNPSGQITAQIYAILICGLILAIPYVVWEIWRFIKPGLHAKEAKNTNGAVLAVSIFFLTGVLFSYFFMLPFSVQFLFTYNPFGVSNEWTLTSYTSLFVQTLLGMGVVFLFPIFTYFLAKMGILSPQFLKTYRKHALIVILVVAAVITPSDIMSMLIAAMPLILLYEVSIWITAYVFKKQLKNEKEGVVKR